MNSNDAVSAHTLHLVSPQGMTLYFLTFYEHKLTAVGEITENFYKLHLGPQRINPNSADISLPAIRSNILFDLLICTTWSSTFVILQ